MAFFQIKNPAPINTDNWAHLGGLLSGFSLGLFAHHRNFESVYVCCRVLQCVAVCCSVSRSRSTAVVCASLLFLQVCIYVAACCTVLYVGFGWRVSLELSARDRNFEYAYAYCSVLQCLAYLFWLGGFAGVVR